MAKAVTLVIVVPNSRTPIRHSDMPIDEAAELAAQITANGTYAGDSASARIVPTPPCTGPKCTCNDKVTAPTRERKSRGRGRNVDPLIQGNWFIRTPRQVRVSSGAWRGESDGTAMERIIARSRAWDM